MAKVKNEHYITIMEFMVRDLELSGNELIAYALVYGFSQNGESEFEGSLSYIAKWLNCSKTTAFNILNKLSDDGFINKIENVKNGIKFCNYKATIPDEEALEKIKERKAQRKQKEKNERRSKKLNSVQKSDITHSIFLNGFAKNLNDDVQKTLTHNNIDILEDNSIDNTNTLSVERASSECAQEPDKQKSKSATRKKEANALFEQLWSLYPLKKGKGQVSDTQKLKLLDIGYEEMERAISRYTKYVDSVDYLHYKNGSTFFNGGYIDYLNENYVEYSDGKNENFSKSNSNPKNINNTKETDKREKESYQSKLEKAKQIAGDEFGEEYRKKFWEGMSDGDVEGMLGMLGIFLNKI